MKFLDILLGRPLASDESEENKVGVAAGIPMLGLDALSSSCYGPEAALTVLLPAGALGLAYIGPLTAVIVALLLILYFSYRQTIAAYPGGGGSYTVAKENLGVRWGLLAAASLLIDYILNVAVGISAGVGALVSTVPSLHPYMLTLCLAILVLITIVNLRGIQSPGRLFAPPTYAFLITLAAVLGIGLVRALLSGGHPRPLEPPASLPAATAAVSWWLVLRAFASGCTAMTGVEAVSNGIQAFRKPSVAHAQRTLTVIIVALAVLLGGIALLAHLYGVGATEPGTPQYQSVISQLTAAIVGRGWLYYLTQASVLAVLCLSANTSFADFPRLCRLIAEDQYLPGFFAMPGRRLVYSAGILILALLSATLLAIFGGVTDRLIPLFAVGAFGAFTLSQAGMVVHARRSRLRLPQAISGVGACCTGLAVVVILVAKFVEGAWVTLILIPGLLFIFHRTRLHYRWIAHEIDTDRPLSARGLRAPIVVVPIIGWSRVEEKALRLALELSERVVCVAIRIQYPEGAHPQTSTPADEPAARLERDWTHLVEEPARKRGLRPPELRVLTSPYRDFIDPLLDLLRELGRKNPACLIIVAIPEIVEAHWYDAFLHNQNALRLKGTLLMLGNPRVVVLSVPWYLRELEASQLQTENEADDKGKAQEQAEPKRTERAPEKGQRGC